ncbi:hypothetical protein AAG570_009210 [Ranatra chinensis]|uniref:GPI ethanolamine phosphate transferase 1 n=1 Tax=Ranatra chinensis TaxID=642074 RepID=A0ABD0YTE8_9HEMI
MWSLGLAVHVVLLMSVKDLYPEERTTRGDEAKCGWEGVDPPADRLVLALVDGLGADVLYRALAAAPNDTFLKEVIEDRGSWGVAIGRPPSSCLDGTMAVTTGVSFPKPVLGLHPEPRATVDSFFDSTSRTYYVGHPRVSAYFPNAKNWVNITYPEEMAKTSWETNCTELDDWVFDRAEELLEKGPGAGMTKVAFFLHLRGFDIAGHVENSKSVRAALVLMNLDRRLELLETKIRATFGDDRTAFLLTSDHGLLDVDREGRHGGSTAQEVETPVVTWGRGVARPPAPCPRRAAAPPRWPLATQSRGTLAQRDLAPLLASLLGLPVPAYSRGALPEAFLNVTDFQQSTALSCNAFQMSELCAALRRDLGSRGVFSLQDTCAPFSEKEANLLRSTILSSMKVGDWMKSAESSREMIALAGRCVRYWTNYYRYLAIPLLVLVSAGWGILTLTTILRQPKEREEQSEVTEQQETKAEVESSSIVRLRLTVKRTPCHIVVVDVFFGLLFSVAIFLVAFEGLPIRFYGYTLAAIAVWWLLVRTFCSLVFAMKFTGWERCSHYGWSVPVYGLLSQLIMLPMSDRLGLTVGLVLLLIYFLLADLRSEATGRTAHWIFSSLPLIILPFYSTLHSSFDSYLYLTGGLTWLTFSAYYVLKSRTNVLDLIVNLLALILLIGSITVGYLVHSGLGVNRVVTTIISWNILIMAIMVPWILGSEVTETRLFQTVMCLCAAFQLLCVRHESLALLAIVVHLTYWMLLEVRGPEEALKSAVGPLPEVGQELKRHDVRRALLYFAYLVFSYYAVGLVESPSGFDSRWASLFSETPTPIMVFVLIKAAIALLIVTIFFVVFLRLTGVSREAFLFLSLFFCNLLGFERLIALSLTRSDSPRLEAALCHHILAQLLSLFVLLLYPIAVVVTGSSLVQKCQRIQEPISTDIPLSYLNSDE